VFDEFAVGDVHVSKARTLTEADIVGFAGLSGDFNPLHTDEEYARATPFRGRIAHGLLVQSVASGLANQTLVFDGTTAAVLEMLIRYRAPTRAGDTVRIELTVRDKEGEPGPRRGWVRFGVEVRNQRDEVVSDGEWLLLMHRARPGERRTRPS
jgi:acyl dehydratase